MPTIREVLDKLLDPVGQAFTDEAARRLIAVRADPDVQQWMSAMAEKANEGLLTPEERSAYEYALTVGTVVAILKSKARAALANSAPSAA